MKIVNWTTEEKIEAMVAKGWVVKKRSIRPDEGRKLVELGKPDEDVVTFRSLPL